MSNENYLIRCTFVRARARTSVMFISCMIFAISVEGRDIRNQLSTTFNWTY